MDRRVRRLTRREKWSRARVFHARSGNYEKSSSQARQRGRAFSRRVDRDVRKSAVPFVPFVPLPLAFVAFPTTGAGVVTRGAAVVRTGAAVTGAAVVAGIGGGTVIPAAAAAPIIWSRIGSTWAFHSPTGTEMSSAPGGKGGSLPWSTAEWAAAARPRRLSSERRWSTVALRSFTA